ncbi:MAG: hypothetical protein HY673_02085 [Chloroflexi bacterium]|nr:hypothetical protein [Chloroflexota bacterium]
MIQAISWWAAVQLLGLITLPLSLRVFKSLPDRGYALSKILGLVLFSYVIWISASARLLPANRATMIFLLLAFSAIFVFWLISHPAEIAGQLKKRLSVIIATEVIFLAAFAVWAIVRSYAPAIASTEKPMDFAFLNSILRSSYMPPPDPWLSGLSLNNYYFGHFIAAVLTKLTNVPASVGFNLIIALSFGLAAIGVFSLVYNLVVRSEGEGTGKKAIAFGLLGIVLFLVASNLEGILELFYSRGVGSPEFWQWTGIKGLTQPNVSNNWYPTEHFFFWRATRVIDTVVDGRSLDYTITEFPFFSFLLADMHAHLLAIPFVLMSLGFSMNVLFTREPMSLQWLGRNAWTMVIMTVGLGSLGVIHSWDLPTYAGILVAAVFLQSYLAPPPATPKLATPPGKAEAMRYTPLGAKWLPPLVISGIVLIGVFFYYFPYYAASRPPVTGVLPWLGPGTRPLYWLILYGLFAVVLVPAALIEARSLKKKGSQASRLLAFLGPLLLGPLVIWTLLMMVIGSPAPTSLALAVFTRWRNLLPVFLFLLLVVWLVIVKARKIKEDSPWGLGGLFVAVLVLGATLIIYGTELFYVRDVLFGNRMNTIFRFHYQVWLLLAVAAAYGIYYMASRSRHSRAGGNPQVSNLARLRKYAWTAWVAVTVLLLAGSLYYPVAASLNYVKFNTKPTLDGLAFLSPPEKEALAWLKNNTPEGAVIAEAFGNDYSEAGRISQRTGIPTIIESAEHQKIWRGADEDFKGRPEDVEAIFRSGNPQQVSALLAKYRVVLIYVGDLERRQYGDQVVTRFNSVADVVFRNQAAAIYRVRGR